MLDPRERSSVERVGERAHQHVARGNYLEAESCLLEGLRSIKTTVSPPSPDHLFLWNELGMVYKYLGQFQKAEHSYRLALGHARRGLKSPEREFFLANLYHNLGGVEHSRKRFRRGERFARKGLQLRRRVAGDGSLAVAADMAALAALLDGQHKFTEAEKLYRRALRVYHQKYGASHPEIAVVLNNLGGLCQATGRAKMAEAYYGTALKMKRRELGASHPGVAATLNNLGMFYQAQGNWREAERCLGKAARMLRRALGRAHVHTKAVQKNYQRIRKRTERFSL